MPPKKKEPTTKKKDATKKAKKAKTSTTSKISKTIKATKGTKTVKTTQKTPKASQTVNLKINVEAPKAKGSTGGGGGGRSRQARPPTQQQPLSYIPPPPREHYAVSPMPPYDPYGQIRLTTNERRELPQPPQPPQLPPPPPQLPPPRTQSVDDIYSAQAPTFDRRITNDEMGLYDEVDRERTVGLRRSVMDDIVERASIAREQEGTAYDASVDNLSGRSVVSENTQGVFNLVDRSFARTREGMKPIIEKPETSPRFTQRKYVPDVPPPPVPPPPARMVNNTMRQPTPKPESKNPHPRLTKAYADWEKKHNKKNPHSPLSRDYAKWEQTQNKPKRTHSDDYYRKIGKIPPGRGPIEYV